MGHIYSQPQPTSDTSSLQSYERYAWGKEIYFRCASEKLPMRHFFGKFSKSKRLKRLKRPMRTEKLPMCKQIFL